MTLLVVCSATGAPGVTTSALTLGWVWPAATDGRHAVVIDADPSGSGVLPGLAQAGVPVGGGVLHLAANDAPIDVTSLLGQCVAFAPDGGSGWVLPGISDPIQASATAAVWRALVTALPELHEAGVDLLVDGGRVGHEHQARALLEAADVVALVLRPDLASVAGTYPVLTRLVADRGPGRATTGLLVGQGRPYTASEVARELGLGAVAVLEHDPNAAAAVLAGMRAGRLDRSRLVGSARTAAAYLAEAPFRVLTGVKR